MLVKDIYVTRFRNLEDQKVEFSAGWNILVGDNGQGKTNLVEAVDMFKFGFSFRTRQSSSLVNHDSREARVEMSCCRDEMDNVYRIDISRSGPPRFARDNKNVRRSDMIGRFLSVLFSPDDLYLSKGEPEIRRKYLDMLISQLHSEYYLYLLDYRRALAQRNKLLKLERERRNSGLCRTMKSWELKIADAASRIVEYREKTVPELGRYLEEYFDMISDGSKASLKYRTSWNGRDYSDFADYLEKNRDGDLAAGYTTAGPHRDLLWFEINGQSSKKYASQGQHRLLSVALKLAEIRLIEDKTGIKPVLVLDDIFSELDSMKAGALASVMPDDLQVLATSTGMGLPEGIMGKSRCLHVNNGVIG